MKKFRFKEIFFIATITCMVLVAGCNSKGLEQIDDKTFLEKLASAPAENVPKETLPTWLQIQVNKLEAESDNIFCARIYKGEWKKRTVYIIRNSYSSCVLCEVEVYYENGENIVWDDNLIESNNFNSTSKSWVLLYSIGNCEIHPLRSGLVDDYSQAEIRDKYEFPIKQGTAKWTQFETIVERIEALQIPDAVLVSISTEGLLETCLEYPYLTDVFFANDYQQGFEALMIESTRRLRMEQVGTRDYYG